MAEFLWTFAVTEVLKKMVKLTATQLGIAVGLKKELPKLKDSLLMVEAILQDVDKIKVQLESVKLWVDKLEDLVFEADVLLDDLAHEDLRRKVEAGKHKIMVRNFVSYSTNPLVFGAQMANKIKAITEMLHQHYCVASSIGLVAISSMKNEVDATQIQAETDSFVDEFGVIGRENEVSEIVNKLVEFSSGKMNLSVLPIVGMGGLGKTAVAKVIFNHESIKRNFDRTIWVCVSEYFIIKNVLRAILETLNANFGGLDRKEAILQELHKLLNDQKYLLVLDDVWNEDCLLWSELKTCLLKITRKSGCVVIVTTRSEKVSEIMETDPRHHLKRLSNDHCWSLFEKCAFLDELPKSPELDNAREALIEKFGGIPLVVKVLGGMVKLGDKNHQELLLALENLVKLPLQDENHVLSTIKSSVDRLPTSSLKQCFAYCSYFPQDFQFKKKELVQMWIAQGFIQPPERDNVTMEDIGDKYFNILLSHSLFQDVVRDKKGRVIYCKMHDLIHDVALAVSNSHKWKLDISMIGHPSWPDDLPIDTAGRTIRTTHCSENFVTKLHMLTFDSRVFQCTVSSFIFLRVLIAHSWSIRFVPHSIGKLKHLRYLDVSQSSIKELPNTVALLYNLQTLKLGRFMVHLPKDMRNLISLRHLEFSFDPCDQTKQMPRHLGRLIQLQTLSSFIVGFDNGCKIKELGQLKNLKGTLSLLCLDRVESKTEAMTANLAGKENIVHMYFQWSLIGLRECSNYNDLDVLEGLQPHTNLQALTIQNFAGEMFPRSVFVENLVDIYLHDCERCETLPMLGQLSKLEVLEIRCLPSVSSIGDEFYGNYHNKKTLFPRLKIFHIFEMNSLEHWKEIKAASNWTIFPYLESFSIVHCQKLKNIPNLFPNFQGHPKLQSLKILGCENLTKLPSGLEFCSSLENIWISNCLNMNSIPSLQNMQNMSVLSIRDLQKLPDGLACLSKLKVLRVHGCLKGYDWSPLIHLISLEDLVLANLGAGAPELPRQLERLAALRSLHISHFDGIEALPEWLGELVSLETLKIYHCKKLKSLPSKEAMSNLTKLSSVQVCGCSQLGDFEKLKVPNVYIISFVP